MLNLNHFQKFHTPILTAAWCNNELWFQITDYVDGSNGAHFGLHCSG